MGNEEDSKNRQREAFMGVGERFIDARECIVHLGRAKANIGPVFGKLKRSFPASTIMFEKTKRVYDVIKELEEDFARFIREGK